MMTRVVGISTGENYLTRARFAAYREAGIGAFEYSIGNMDRPVPDFKSVVASARAEGILPWSYHLPFSPFEKLDPASLDPEKRAFTVSYQADLIKRAADAGFRHAVIHASGEPIPDETRAASLRAAGESLVSLTEVASHAGIVLAVEDLPRSCIGNCPSDLLYLTSLHPALRVCFDTNHLLNCRNADLFSALAEKIVTLHISDYDFINERHWLPGEGKNDWIALMDQLDAIGYNGVLMYELNLSANWSIARERDITPADIRQNADELEARKPLTPRGTPYPDLGMWERKGNL